MRKTRFIISMLKLAVCYPFPPVQFSSPQKMISVPRKLTFKIGTRVANAAWLYPLPLTEETKHLKDYIGFGAYCWAVATTVTNDAA